VKNNRKAPSVVRARNWRCSPGRSEDDDVGGGDVGECRYVYISSGGKSLFFRLRVVNYTNSHQAR